MNKAEFTARVAQAANINKVEAAKYLEAVVGTITSALKEDQEVVLLGFGAFSVRDRACRVGRNPKTGEPISIDASRLPYFKAGKTLKDAVRAI
ncbi:MAG: DNA-binding protein HU [Zetaproteobacteria bacterium]|nr:DNA-binding protein HU [Pseudobdellovibrionaceae bacterium]|tara:strand:+ start:2029 stop:2307 length:279 start_codon:yes stop_codon:yes gene_type:complete